MVKHAECPVNMSVRADGGRRSVCLLSVNALPFANLPSASKGTRARLIAGEQQRQEGKGRGHRRGERGMVTDGLTGEGGMRRR